MRKTHVIVLDFGYTKDGGVESSIHDLADCVMANYAERDDVTILAQEETYARLRAIGFPMMYVAKIDVGQATTNGTSGGGTYHVLARAKEMITYQVPLDTGRIAEFPFEAVVVAHQLHVKRAIRQGALFQLKLRAANYLPFWLHREAAQWWCRSAPLWYIREAIGYIPLKIAGQL